MKHCVESVGNCELHWMVKIDMKRNLSLAIDLLLLAGIMFMIYKLLSV